MTAPVAVSNPPAPPDKRPHWLVWLAKNEPVLVSAIVAAIGVFSTVRWAASGADLTAQLVSGLLPVALGLIVRQFVTPAVRNATPGQLDNLRNDLMSLQTAFDMAVSGNVRKVFDSIVAAAFGATDPQLQTAAPPASGDSGPLAATGPPPPLLSEVAAQPVDRNPEGW